MATVQEREPLLKLQSSWRYCRVRAGEKKPYPNGWQRMPLTLEQVDSENIGLMLGPLGNGVCAIDFDGTSAWQWIKQQGIDSIPATVTWTSGKQDRCQMAFQVPEELWPYLKTVKVTHTKDPGIADGEGFEFRWAGGQSVLPPSIHPSTQKPYFWLQDCREPVAELPIDIIELWLKWSAHTSTSADVVDFKRVEDLTESDVNEVNHLLGLLRQKHLKLDYEAWRNVSWAVFKSLGIEAGSVVMAGFYPEQQPGEYRQLAQGYNPSLSPGLGTLRHLVKDLLAEEPQTGIQAMRRFLKRQTRYY